MKHSRTSQYILKLYFLLEQNGIDNHYWKHLNDLDLDEKESFHEVNVVANKNLTEQE